MPHRKTKTWLILLAVLAGLVIVLFLPPVWTRVVYYSREAYTSVKYWLKPPGKAVFVPSNTDNEFVATSVAATLAAAFPSATPTPTVARSTPFPTPSPTVTPTPFPPYVYLKGVTPEAQLWNNCGPATLSMNLSFYGWKEGQVAAAEILKPNDRDKNVMPYEMADFVNENTNLRALWRMGGDVQTMKALLNVGIPVLVEKGFEPANIKKEGWMGHFNLLIGYDDTKSVFVTQDSYFLIHPPTGVTVPADYRTFPGFSITYDDMVKNWRAFNYVFVVVYPPDKENDVLNALGPLSDADTAYQVAYDRAMAETGSMTDIRDRFFTWYNAGTSLVYLKDYGTASTAFDTAFGLYPQIEEAYRPYRIIWYQTGPYFAYYFSGRYQDVINLADQTLQNMSEPILEESYYWRGLSYLALGDNESAIRDFRDSLKYHVGFAPSMAMLEQLGETP